MYLKFPHSPYTMLQTHNMAWHNFWSLFFNIVKSWVSYFLRNFYFSPNDSNSKTMKDVFYFSFRSRDIQISVFLPSPFFLLVSHCLRAWPKINFKVYDAINCLNKNLMTHFVWYLEKERRYDIKTLAIDTVLNTEYFCGKIMQKMCTKS